jgi:hypothetical protein
MKTSLLLIALMFSTPAFARIGETEAQIEVRYGEPRASKRENGLVNRAYTSRGFDILVSFEKGISCGEEYQKNPPTPLLDDDIAALLGANSGGGKWHQVPDSSSDRLVLIVYRGAGKRVAMHNAVRNTLIVTSEDFVARMSSRHAEKLKGF